MSGDGQTSGLDQRRRQGFRPGPLKYSQEPDRNFARKRLDSRDHHPTIPEQKVPSSR